MHGPSDEDLKVYAETSDADERINVTAMRMAVLANLGIVEIRNHQRWLIGLLLVLIVLVFILAVRLYAGYRI